MAYSRLGLDGLEQVLDRGPVLEVAGSQEALQGAELLDGSGAVLPGVFPGRLVFRKNVVGDINSLHEHMVLHIDHLFKRRHGFLVQGTDSALDAEEGEDYVARENHEDDAGQEEAADDLCAEFHTLNSRI